MKKTIGRHPSFGFPEQLFFKRLSIFIFILLLEPSKFRCNVTIFNRWCYYGTKLLKMLGSYSFNDAKKDSIYNEREIFKMEN